MPGSRYYPVGWALVLGLFVGPAAADAPVWLRDLDAAEADARAAKKDMFLLFTGVGWCQPCMEFDKKVLKQAAFLDSVRTQFTLVEFDHTVGDTPAEQKLRARYAPLEKRYLVHAFPTVVLADAASTPYAVMTGYESLEVPVTLAWIAKARAARDLRDREFRAGRLHEGIQAVAGLLGTLDERHDDPVLVYYKDQVAEIGRSGSGEIRKHYDDHRAARDRWRATQAIFDRLRKFDEANDYRGAIAFLDESLKTTTDRTMRFRLEHTRINFLERDKKDEEALRSVRALLRRDDLTADERYNLSFHEAANLFRLGRVDEGIAIWDRLIAAADTSVKRVRRLEWKASMIPIKTHRELKMAAWRACRAEARRGSDEWLTATHFLADDARKAGRPREALALFREEFNADPSVGTVTEIAECHIDLGEPTKAREWIAKAEADAATLKASARQSDQQQAERVEKRIKALRARLN
jgi:tetratricopeptide (TPR) repeat protein/thioredoxin-related protein